MIKEYTYLKNKGFEGYDSSNPNSICLGFFDGLHLGHLHLVSKALKENDNVNLLTFDGSLKFLTSKREKDEVLTSVEDRKAILDSLGVKSLFVVCFTQAIADTEPIDFIKEILLPLNIKKIYIGSDFRFGKLAKGDIPLLKKYFSVEVSDFIYAYDKVKISSSLIVDLIQKGRVEEANKYLGRDYFIKGEVVHGLENGRKMGFPTLNIEPSFNYVIPKNGVYATIVEIQGRQYLSMTDIGYHPTIDKLKRISIETNVIDADLEAYGQKIKLSFLSFIRDEVKFNSTVDLILQLKKDESKIKEQYSSLNPIL